MNDPAAEERLKTFERCDCCRSGCFPIKADCGGHFCHACYKVAKHKQDQLAKSEAALTAAAEQLRESNTAMERLQAENNKLRRFKNEVIGARVMLSSGIIATPEEQKKSTLFIQAAKASQGLKSSLDKLEECDER